VPYNVALLEIWNQLSEACLPVVQGSFWRRRVSTVENGSLRCLVKLFSSLRCRRRNVSESVIVVKVFKVCSIFYLLLGTLHLF
jgi:hypothetical protein